jgi:hypothetical protein
MGTHRTRAIQGPRGRVPERQAQEEPEARRVPELKRQAQSQAAQQARR